MKPKRIQRKRTKGWRMPKNTVYVGRPSKWGNSFTGRDIRDVKGIVGAYKESLTERQKGDAIRELKGKNLACWCPLDRPCHADVLLKIANRTVPKNIIDRTRTYKVKVRVL